MPNPPKPTQLRVIEGNPGKRPLTKNEPEPDKLQGFPEPPERFNSEARKEWERTGPVLHKAGLITAADLPMFEAYCQAWGNYVIAQADYDGTPLIKGQKGNLVKNPSAQIARDNLDKAIALAREFGMTPSSRSRISLPGGGSGKTSEGLEAALGG